MKINDWLNSSTKKLSQNKISSARLDCLLMLEDCLKNNRSLILAHTENELTPTQIKTLNIMLKRRLNSEPMVYIRGFIEFYGLKFKVNNKVLIPRPETEDFINLVLDLDINNNSNILDVGCGCGAIAISLAKNTEHKIYASDISLQTLKIAHINNKTLHANVKIYKDNLFENPKTNFDVLTANLPYVPIKMQKKLQPELSYEPKIALWQSGDGLGLYKELFQQINEVKNKPTFVLTESLKTQHAKMIVIAKRYGYSINKTSGLVQVFIKVK